MVTEPRLSHAGCPARTSSIRLPAKSRRNAPSPSSGPEPERRPRRSRKAAATARVAMGLLVLSLAGARAAFADTIDLHIFPYCAPGTFCGHGTSQADLDAYVCKAVQEVNLQFEGTGLSFRPTIEPADGTSPDHQPRFCNDTKPKPMLCQSDADCPRPFTCEVATTPDTDKYYEIGGCPPESRANRALRAQWKREVALQEDNAISLLVTKKKATCCTGVNSTSDDPTKIGGIYCNVNPTNTAETKGATWAHEMGHYWGLAHTFCGCGGRNPDDPADTASGTTFHDCDSVASAGSDLKCTGGTDWGKACKTDADCAPPGICARDALPDVDDTPPDACPFERLGRRCTARQAGVFTKCTTDADCASVGGTCSECIRKCTNDGSVCSKDADCPAGGTCECPTGADEDQFGDFVDGHEFVSGLDDPAGAGPYRLDVLSSVDPGSPHSEYCFAQWREVSSGGQLSSKPDDLTNLLRTAMNYYGSRCHGPYVVNGQLQRAFTSSQVDRMGAARSQILALAPAALPDVCADRGGDSDSDGICDEDDNCPTPTRCFGSMNTCQEDTDGDHIGDACDLCPGKDVVTGDIDGDCIGDACDPDIDNDGCPNETDQHPMDRMLPVGSKFSEKCGSKEILYGDEGDDTDGDGFANCEDRDDDNDGICDLAEAVEGCGERVRCDVPPTGCVAGPDACPELAGEIDCLLQGDTVDCEPDWLVCSFGGCVEFYLSFRNLIDPDPSREVVFDDFQIVNRSIYLEPQVGKTLSEGFAAIAGLAAGAVGSPAALDAATTPDRIRLEIRRKDSRKLVAVVGEYDPSQLQLPDSFVDGAFIQLVPRDGSEGPSTLSVALRWGIGSDAGDSVPDSDGDGVPDGFDNCVLAANPRQVDSDTDGNGNACDADLDGNGQVDASDVDAVLACQGADLTLNPPVADAHEDEPDGAVETGAPQSPDPQVILRATLCAAADLDESGRVDEADLDRARSLLGREPGPSAVVGGSVASPPVASTLAAVCSGGSKIRQAAVHISRLGEPLGGQVLRVSGALALPSELPAHLDPSVSGAQLLLEDLGRGGRPVLDLTSDVLPVPPGAQGSGCEPQDGWRVHGRGKTFVYRNPSRRLDPPVCEHGSDRGVLQLVLQDMRASNGQVKFDLRSRGATLPAVVGPLRLTFVPGGDSEGAAGACGVEEFSAQQCAIQDAGREVICQDEGSGPAAAVAVDAAGPRRRGGDRR